MRKISVFILILSITAVFFETHGASVKQIAAIKMAQNIVRKLITSPKLQNDLIVVLDDLISMDANEIRAMLEMGKMLLNSQSLLSKATQEEEQQVEE
ncbi:hypothetical protein BpHYR1_040822 [Brachionus plicatilis]|uniref:Uncharacterized protein n=1 Tax=Brachionus plicatilis TaxID=10195 RepID=A0A3M7RZR4_BRAPC|nr:hypothetical protein BpHYR1_040822 [Brachionus plicatilis]